MSNSLIRVATLMIISSVLIISMNIPASGAHARKQTTQLFQNICQGKESVTKVVFYVQDLLAGPSKTVYDVANASITEHSPTSFGQVRVLDDLLTAEPDINSEKVGRAQGMIISSDFTYSALTMNLNFVFTSGAYNGSTISILGRNEINKKSRELSVVGGTGVFRFARGYAVTKTHSYDVETSYGILEYTIYVTYYADNDASSSPSLAASM